MPIYRFDPVDPDHPDWLASHYVGPCRVHAPSTMRAREILDRFFDGRGELAYLDRGEAYTPWRDPERAPHRSYQDIEGQEYREGLIETFRPYSGDYEAGTPIGDQPGEWVAVNADRLPSPGGEADNGAHSSMWGEAEWNKGTWGSRTGMTSARPHLTPSDELGGLTDRTYPPLTVTDPRPVTQEVVARVIQNRFVLDSYSLILKRHLDDLIGPEGVAPGDRNVSVVETLGLPADINEEDLLVLLRELRDEIRLFREALDKAADAPDPSMSPSTLERLRDVGIKHLDALATNKVFVSTVGASLGCSLWSLLERAGVIVNRRGILTP